MDSNGSLRRAGIWHGRKFGFCDKDSAALYTEAISYPSLLAISMGERTIWNATMAVQILLGSMVLILFVVVVCDYFCGYGSRYYKVATILAKRYDRKVLMHGSPACLVRPLL